MYKAAYYDRNNNVVHIWDDEKGKIEKQYKKYGYVIDKNGDFVTMDGYKVKKVTSWSKEQEKQGIVYEHDVPVLMRTLVDEYWQTDEISTGHIIMFLDIEVAKEGKYSEARDALNTITSISFYTESTGYVCLLLDLSKTIKAERRTIKNTKGDSLEVHLEVCFSETQLLSKFISYFAHIRPTIVSGWNSELYDLPYLYNRIQSKLGRAAVQKLSEIGIVECKDIDTRGNQTVKIAGSSHLDYMILYKKFTPNEQPRYNLDSIAKTELGRGKVQYEGDLQKLYETDIDKFIEYNVNDVELCVELDKKLDYIQIALGLCHKGHVPYEDIIYSSRYLEGAVLTYCKRQNLITMKTPHSQDSTPAQGAFVKLPKPGLYKYIYDEDLSGMYPANIMTLNISPETKFGKVLEYDPEDFANDVEKTYTIEKVKKITIMDQFSFNDDNSIIVNNLREFCVKNNLSISANGILYRKDKKGVVPSILELWSEERKQFRKIAADKKLAGDEDGYKHFDRKQYVTKILGNSFYGYLLLHGSRFNDKDNGEATTLTGVSLIKQSMKIADFYYNKKLGTANKEFVLYCDTDSVAGDSIVRPEIGASIRICDLFDNLKQTSWFIDANNREFTFPELLKLPYYNPDDGKIQYGSVEYIEKHIVKKRRFKIKTKGGKEIIVSGDHSIMVLNDGKLIEKKASEITLGDRVICF